MSNPDRNKDLVRRFVEAVNARDFETLATILTPDFTRHCPATPDVTVRSPADFRRFLEQDAEVFPDERVKLETVVAEGDLVGFWARFTGTQSGGFGPFPATGRRAEIEFAGVFRIAAGRIADVKLTWDNVDLLSQLGHFPPGGTPSQD